MVTLRLTNLTRRDPVIFMGPFETEAEAINMAITMHALDPRVCTLYSLSSWKTPAFKYCDEIGTSSEFEL